jgi:hypothetical protein
MSHNIEVDFTLDEVYSHLINYKHHHSIQEYNYEIGRGISGGSSMNFTQPRAMIAVMLDTTTNKTLIGRYKHPNVSVVVDEAAKATMSS